MTTIAPHIKPKADQCAHNRYRLTCDQYELLRLDANDHCQICRVSACATRLVIDHDWNLGVWAVRGLLCSGCNTTRADAERSLDADLQRYLANPWYGRMFGVGPEVPPEPPAGTRVTYRSRVWIREADRWYGQNGQLDPMEPTWEELHYAYGAHNLASFPPRVRSAKELEIISKLRAERDALNNHLHLLERERSWAIEIAWKRRDLSKLNSAIARKTGA